jgi:glycosyltransferase involved in cell wall biosynthesis
MGLDRLLRAVRKLFDRGLNFQLMVGGTGPLRSILEKLANQLDLSHNVSFLGYIPDSQLPLMYAACDAFVLPSAALECFGLIVIEALACGRPVIASPVGAIPEILNLIEPKWMAKSPEADAIAELIGDFLSGKLPEHAPDELRSLVARHYESRKTMETLARVLLN